MSSHTTPSPPSEECLSPLSIGSDELRIGGPAIHANMYPASSKLVLHMIIIRKTHSAILHPWSLVPQDLPGLSSMVAASLLINTSAACRTRRPRLLMHLTPSPSPCSSSLSQSLPHLGGRLRLSCRETSHLLQLHLLDPDHPISKFYSSREE